MSKIRYIISTIVYLVTGFIFGMGIIDNDPVVKILSVVFLMFATMLYVFNTWAFLFREKEMHKWFDELQEPKRLLVFFIPAAMLIVGTNIPYYGINIVSLGLLVIMALSRFWYLHKAKTQGGQ